MSRSTKPSKDVSLNKSSIDKSSIDQAKEQVSNADSKSEETPAKSLKSESDNVQENDRTNKFPSKAAVKTDAPKRTAQKANVLEALRPAPETGPVQSAQDLHGDSPSLNAPNQQTTLSIEDKVNTNETVNETSNLERRQDNMQDVVQDAEVSPNVLPPVKNVANAETSKIAQVPKNAPVRSLSPIFKTLSELTQGNLADCYVQLVAKEKKTTKDGKPFFKLVFRDNKKTLSSIIWSDNPLYSECENNLFPGKFYKIRVVLKLNVSFGYQLELRQIRETNAEDAQNGFSIDKCRPTSDVPPETIFSELLSIASVHLGKTRFLPLVQKIFKDNRVQLCEVAASRFHQRIYAGGLLEHTLSVTKIAIFLCDHFFSLNPLLQKSVSKPLVVAGAILHDIGKLLDTQMEPSGPQHTLAGELLGHHALGMSIIHQYAKVVGLAKDDAYRLEHLVLSHSRFADWDAPKPPASLEAMILHYADYADSTFANSIKILDEDEGNGAFTLHKGPFGVQLLKPPTQPTRR